MSISLNNHESRIKALEDTTFAVSGIIESKVSNPGYVKFGNGFQICFGNMSGSSGSKSFAKSFTSAAVCIVGSTLYSRILREGDFTVTSLNKSGFSYALNPSANTGYYIAIGYLISDRILNYAYACKSLLFTPLKTIGGVK